MNYLNNFRIAARGLVVQNSRLLFVSDDGYYWYPPGGRLEGYEDLRTCVAREVYEETGFVVQVGALLYVQECMDIRDHIHKIHFYFQTEIEQGTLTEHWCDTGGTVQYRRFFSAAEIKAQNAIVPRFLGSVQWSKDPAPADETPYQGCIVMRGFEMSEADAGVESLKIHTVPS